MVTTLTLTTTVRYCTIFFIILIKGIPDKNSVAYTDKETDESWDVFII